MMTKKQHEIYTVKRKQSGNELQYITTTLPFTWAVFHTTKLNCLVFNFPYAGHRRTTNTAFIQHNSTEGRVKFLSPLLTNLQLRTAIVAVENLSLRHFLPLVCQVRNEICYLGVSQLCWDGRVYVYRVGIFLNSDLCDDVG